MPKRRKVKAVTDLADAQLVKWATRHTKRLGASDVFVGVLNDGPLDKARVEFYLHVGFSLIQEKEIIFAIPSGTRIPPKLEAIADVVVRYDPANLASLEAATAEGLAKLGAVKQ